MTAQATLIGWAYAATYTPVTVARAKTPTSTASDDRLEAHLAEEYRGASSCLFEAQGAFSVQGIVDTRRQRQAERAAQLLLDHLETG